jgi:8-oxo-dGTP pyrophosphatase MutT (NUDIX family)
LKLRRRFLKINPWAVEVKTIERKACRALLLTPENEVLLIKIDNPDGNWTGWITPGGGIEAGESEEEALRRELLEELGLEKFKIEAKVWKRFHRFLWNETTIAQEEVFFLVRTGKFQPEPKAKLSETELLDFKGFKWWKSEDLKNSGETFSPTKLELYLSALLESGCPSEPLDVGI